MNYCALLHVFQGDGIVLRAADATPDSAGDDDSFIDASARPIRVDNVRLFFAMFLANCPATEATGRVSRAFTMPAFHKIKVKRKM